MRNILLILNILLLMTSCADMHNPILHSGGMIKFIPEVRYEVDSVIIERMNKYFPLDWETDIFYKELNDFHVNWWNISSNKNIDFIDESQMLRSPYGCFDCIWHTNHLENNRTENNKIYTEAINDTVCKIPDFVFTKHDTINVKENIHDYDGKSDHLQIFEETLLQRSFLYIVQINLINNEGRVKKCGNFLISGLASGFDIYSENNYSSTCYIFNSKSYIDKNFIIGSFISFGLPDCNSYKFRNDYRNGLCKYENTNKLFIQLMYSNGKRIIEVDVSNQLALQPTGGLLIVDLDIDEYPPNNADMSDSFDVLVNDYENTDQYYNSFN